MVDILHHELPIQAQRLGLELQEVLDSIEPGGEELPKLQLDRAERPSLVFTGAYSTGKSSLIKALTDGVADVLVAADIATATVSEFDWNNVVTLVDTPGMHAGLAAHDAVAEEALIRADLVVFTSTVELFDDDATGQLRHVLGDLGKREQTLVVITKAGGMTAAPGVRSDAVRVAAEGDDVPFVECDSNFYLRSLVEPDVARRERLAMASNMAGVAQAIDELAARRGQLARYCQPFQQIRAIAELALSRLAEDPADAAMLQVLARQRKALSDHEGRIEATAAAESNRFLAICANAAERFADAVEAADDSLDDAPEGAARSVILTAAEGDLENALQSAMQRMSSEVESIIASQVRDLQSEFLEIDSGASAQYIISLQTTAVAMPDGPLTPTYSRDVLGAANRPAPGWLPEAQRMLTSSIDFWGAGEGMKASAGSRGHAIVLEIGGLLGKKFKPWGAVRIANGIGKAANVAAVALPVIVNVTGVLMDEASRRKAEQARARRRRVLLQSVLEQATVIADEARALVRTAVRVQFADPYSAIEEMRLRVLAAQQTRSEMAIELTRIVDACTAQLARAQGGADGYVSIV